MIIQSGYFFKFLYRKCTMITMQNLWKVFENQSHYSLLRSWASQHQNCQKVVLNITILRQLVGSYNPRSKLFGLVLAFNRIFQQLSFDLFGNNFHNSKKGNSKIVFYQFANCLWYKMTFLIMILTLKIWRRFYNVMKTSTLPQKRITQKDNKYQD